MVAGVVAASVAFGALVASIPWRKLFRMDGGKDRRRNKLNSVFDRLGSETFGKVLAAAEKSGRRGSSGQQSKERASSPGVYNMPAIREQVHAQPAQKQPEEPPANDMLSLIERQRVREAAAAAAEARLGHPEDSAGTSASQSGAEQGGDEVSPVMESARGFLLGNNYEYGEISGDLRQQIAEATEAMRVLKVKEVDKERRLCLREQEAVERAVAIACEDFAQYKSELWTAESELAALLEKLPEKAGGQHAARPEKPETEYATAQTPPVVPARQVMVKSASLTPSYIS